MEESNTVTLNIQESYSIDRLYERVKGHDLVLTVDAPLADALNARLSTPHIGPFATTPRRLAMKDTPAHQRLGDKRELFVNILDQTRFDWKRASYLLENILSCWKETGDPKNILEYDRYDEGAAEKIIDILKNSVNQYSAIENYTVPKSKDLAVIAPHQFTELDKKVLPNKYETVQPFKDHKTPLPEFNIFNSATQIVQTILDKLERLPLDPRDVAIVMKKDSNYRYLIEALLRSNDIPYMIAEDITQQGSVRKFLNLIRFSFYRRGIKLKNIRSLAKEKMDPEEEEYFLHSSEKSIKELIETIPEKTFEELLDHDYFEEDMEELRAHLEDTNLLHEQITLQRLNSLKYYLETFDIKVKESSQGVLIASPDSSTYIDRPTVFYLGLDTSWTPEPPTTPWIDEKEYDKKNLKDFKILLQNGKDRYFLVRDKNMNRTVVPSFYFNEFTDRTIESFTDLDHELSRKNIPGPENPFDKRPIETESEETMMMSQSALNSFAYCPKDYFFSNLIDSPDRIYFRRGTLFHDLAEFLTNYPEMAEHKEKIIEKMIEELSPFLEDHQRPMTRTRFRIGLENLVHFLKNREPEMTELEGYEKDHTDNVFSDLFDRPITSEFTEVSFYNKAVGAKGKVDLVLSRDLIIDYKSGSKKTLSKVMSNSEIENIDEKQNFQAKMYIAHHRHHYPNTPINFIFYHLLENERDFISGDKDPSDNILEIEYHPEEFNDITDRREMFEWLKSSKNRKKVLTKLGYDDYHAFFKNRSIPDLEKDELLEHQITTEFINYSQDKIGNYKYVKKACRSMMKKFVKFRNTRYFKSDIDEFEVFLKQNIEQYNEYKTTDFPVGDVDPDNIENKDLVIIDE